MDSCRIANLPRSAVRMTLPYEEEGRNEWHEERRGCHERRKYPPQRKGKLFKRPFIVLTFVLN